MSKEEAAADLLRKAHELPARDAIVLVGASWYGWIYGRVSGMPNPLTRDDAAPGASELDIAAANSLLAQAAIYGNRWWDESAEGRKAVEEAMRADHPGFLESSYEVALNLGTFQSR